MSVQDEPPGASIPGEEERMLAAAPGVPALGRGPTGGGAPRRRDYHHPAAGWGAAVSVAQVVARTREPVSALRALQDEP
jgi:hypothetical protein